MSTRKFFPAQAKVFPRAVFNPSRVGLYIPSKPRAVIETQGIKPPSEKKNILGDIPKPKDCFRYPPSEIKNIKKKTFHREKNYPREGKWIFSLGKFLPFFLP